VREIRSAYSILVGKPEGKKSLGIPRCRWRDNIRMDLKEIVWEGVDWMHSVGRCGLDASASA
jgi:hypothetical protein